MTSIEEKIIPEFIRRSIANYMVQIERELAIGRDFSSQLRRTIREIKKKRKKIRLYVIFNNHWKSKFHPIIRIEDKRTINITECAFLKGDFYGRNN